MAQDALRPAEVVGGDASGQAARHREGRSAAPTGDGRSGLSTNRNYRNFVAIGSNSTACQQVGLPCASAFWYAYRKAHTIRILNGLHERPVKCCPPSTNRRYRFPLIMPLNDWSYYIARNVLFMQWEAPVAMIDIDVPDAGHIAHGTVTAHSKQHAYSLMEMMASIDGVRMRIRVYETAGGLRGFVTSHSVSAAHLWREPDFAQHLLNSGVDPYYLIGCMATCKFAARLSPKWVGERPRDNDDVVFCGIINEDVFEIPSYAGFVADLAGIQASFAGLEAEQLISALARFRSGNEAHFDAPVPAKPWSIIRGLYQCEDSAMMNRQRELVHDVRMWTRTVPVPDPSCRFMSGPRAAPRPEGERPVEDI